MWILSITDHVNGSMDTVNMEFKELYLYTLFQSSSVYKCIILFA